MAKMDTPFEAGDGAAALVQGTGTRRARPVSPALVIDLYMVWEAGLIVLAAWIAKVAYLDHFLESNADVTKYLGVAALLGAVSLLVFRWFGLYDLTRLRAPIKHAGHLVAGLAMTFLIIVAALYALKTAETFSRGWVLTWFAITALWLIASRMAVHSLLSTPLGQRIFRQRVAVFGAGELGATVIAELRAQAPSVEIVGVFDDRATRGIVSHLTVLGNLRALVDFGRREFCDQIVVAVPTSNERLSQVMDDLSTLPVDVRVCREALQLPHAVVGLSSLGPLQLFEIQKRPISGRDDYIKAVMDYTLAGLGLLVLAPYFPLIALAIKLDSPGPVFFRQRRHGYNHQVIRVFKFRTMSVLEDGDVVQQAKRNDQRVTRVGRILRATNLDELPQLLNVMRGEMSLVGPRPHALAHDLHYANLVKRYKSRLRVKPGITGWAQVNGLAGETADPDRMRQRVEHDLFYIDNWSPWLDLTIIWRTVVMSIAGKLVH